jgi:predicted nucleotidyltransferase
MINLEDGEKNIVIEILNKFVPNHEVWVFGSRTGSDIRSYSDLDIVILGSEELPLIITAEIKNAFQESDLPFRVDVLDWNDMSEEFREIIKQKYEILITSKTA